jgi:hypothetical protein
MSVPEDFLQPKNIFSGRLAGENKGRLRKSSISAWKKGAESVRRSCRLTTSRVLNHQMTIWGGRG